MITAKLDEIKQKAKSRDNNLVYMKLKSLMDKLGYKQRSDKINQKVVEYCTNNNLIITYEDNIINDLYDVPYDDFINFRYYEGENIKQKFYYQNAGKINVAKGQNNIQLYRHQREAINNLSEINNNKNFSGILAIPTGGGKTLAAVYWLLRDVIDNNKKVLWIAHRHELLTQAYLALKNNAYKNLLRNRDSFNYRIISGEHDYTRNVKPEDDFIIASKDSLYSNMDSLRKQWLANIDDVYLVIDEAHHAPAKTYRKVIDGLKNNTKNFNMLGLTATPFRTAEEDKGLLSKLFVDDIIYKIDLEKLINRGILSEPYFEELDTNLDIARELSTEDIKKINKSDLRTDIAEKIAKSKDRNNMIVNQYVNNKSKYGKLLVFAIDITHAITLTKLFRARGIKAEFIVSSLKDAATYVTISAEENKKKIDKFRKGNCDVLINVNILTEGVDLPDTESVFLTRPTISTILMTQMIGRALRGKKAGGTDKAYIVSFLDEWKDKINWINPEKLYNEDNIFKDEDNVDQDRIVKLISIKKIEEFADIMDQTIDTSHLEKLDFINRVPAGIYHFSYLIDGENDQNIEKKCEILVYNDMENSYKKLISNLPELFTSFDIKPQEKDLSDEVVNKMAKKAEEAFFLGKDMTIPYKIEDIKELIHLYNFKEEKPKYFKFEDREKYDISLVAKNIYEKDFGSKTRKKYENQIWNKDKHWELFFDDKRYFINQISMELDKLRHPGLNQKTTKPTVDYEMRDIEDLSMWEIAQKSKKNL